MTTSTGDLSAVQAFTTEQLATELEAATTRMNDSRHNRAGLVCADAKMAVDVLSAERRRREAAAIADVDLRETFRVQATQHTAVRTAHFELDIECDERGCREAYSHRDSCSCRCQGEGHGLRYRAEAARSAAAIVARDLRAGGAVARLVAMGGMVDDDTDSAF